MSENTAKEQGRRRHLGTVGRLVDARLKRLQRGVTESRPWARRDLAELRMALGRPPGDTPAVWGLTEVPLETDRASQEEPTAAEWAVHISMCLYGMHQQSRQRPAHRPGVPFGHAVRMFAGDQAEESPVWRRFTATMLATSIEGVREHLQAIVGQLRAREETGGFDYGALTDDLLRWQRPGVAPQVRLQWQREFYAPLRQMPTTGDQEEETQQLQEKRR